MNQVAFLFKKSVKKIFRIILAFTKFIVKILIKKRSMCILLSLTVDKSEKGKNYPKWKQVFSVKALDFHSKQSDLVVHTCNRAGNIIMAKKEVIPVVEAFMRQLKKKENARYTFTILSNLILNVLAFGGVIQ